MNVDKLLFIHIPKTAGSSLRVAAKMFFGDDKAIFDYGPVSNETSPGICEYEYEKKDRYGCGINVIDKSRFLSGHFSYPKYAPLYEAKQVVTFVRDPFEQVRSHYEHFVRHHGYDKDFEVFISSPQFSNIQSKALAGSVIDSIGFVGLTEQYNDSIRVLNAYYGIEIPVLDINKNDSKKDQYEFTEKERDLIKQNNKQDLALYRNAVLKFESQRDSIDHDKLYVRGSRLPVAPKDRRKVISGWACSYENSDAQMVSVMNGEEKLASILANEYRPFAKERDVGRNGYVGFSFKVPDSLGKGTKLSFVSESSGAILFNEKI